MKINSISIQHLESLLEKIAKKLRGKPIQNTPRTALRSPLDGLYVLSGIGLPIVLYKGGDYERKRGVKYSIRPY